MQLIIEDGAGTGKKAKVNDENKLITEATTIRSIEDQSLKGNSYAFGLPLVNLTTVESRVLWLKNTSSTKNFHVEDFIYVWNGGNTTFARTMFATVYLGEVAPTANNFTSAGFNLNLTSPNIAQGELEVWNGAGTGMTIPSPMPFGLNGIVPKGTFIVPAKGAFILGTNDSLTIGLKGEEDGIGSVIVFGYYKDKS